METIQSDHQILSSNCLNHSLKAYFDYFVIYQHSNKDELRNRILYLGNYFNNTNPYGVVRLHSHFIIHLPCLSL